MDRLESLFQALVKHRLKLSPKICQVSRKELVNKGHLFIIKDQTIQSLRSKVEAIQKILLLKMLRNVTFFVNFVII